MIEIDKLIEELADQEHERWSGWMRYLFDHFTDENFSRWKQQMITPYAELPEHSKESDRKEARKTMEIVGPIITELEAALGVLLDQVDYTAGACTLTEMVGAVLPLEVIERARKALGGRTRRSTLMAFTL